MKKIPKATFKEAMEGAKREREYQDAKWGTVDEYPHMVYGWVNIMEDELQKAAEASSTEDMLKGVLKVVATGVACLEQHGVHERTRENNE